MCEDNEDNNSRVLCIADAMNTHNRALVAVQEKGYCIYLMPDEREEYLGDFWAIKDKRDFVAADPLRLLGLITLWEHFGDNWQERKVPDIMDEVLSTAFPEDEYMSLTEEAFTRLVKHLSIFFDAIGQPLPPTITRAKLVHIMKTYYREDDE